MANTQLKSALRRAGYAIVLVLAGVYVVVSLSGPHGIPALLEKRRAIRALEEQNVELNKQLQERRERIRRLRESPAEQELEIRRRLKLLRPGETEFIIPGEAAKEPSR